jgi:hypothetical protein
VTQKDPSEYSDPELVAEIRVVDSKIELLDEFIESPKTERKRSRNIALSTAATAAGLFGLALTPLSAILAGYGFIKWATALRDDAEASNKRRKLLRRKSELESRLERLESELGRRMRD